MTSGPSGHYFAILHPFFRFWQKKKKDIELATKSLQLLVSPLFFLTLTHRYNQRFQARGKFQACRPCNRPRRRPLDFSETRPFDGRKAIPSPPFPPSK